MLAIFGQLSADIRIVMRILINEKFAIRICLRQSRVNSLLQVPIDCRLVCQS
jgi:hypothetical protein